MYITIIFFKILLSSSRSRKLYPKYRVIYSNKCKFVNKNRGREIEIPTSCCLNRLSVQSNHFTTLDSNIE